MTDETPYFVAQCARAIATKEQCWYRPARINACGVAPIIHGQCSVFVTAQSDGEIVCWRFTFRRMDQYHTPIISTDLIQRLASGEPKTVSYWTVPGNVRDLAATVGHRWLGVRS